MRIPGERARCQQPRIVAAVLLVPVLSFGAPTTTHAQDEGVILAARAYPVAIHEGTCNELLTEPSYDLGLAKPRPMIADPDDVDDDALTTGDFYANGDDRLVDETTVLLTGEDFDSDGIADFGFDLNENEVLDADEVFPQPIVWSFHRDLATLAPVETDDGDDIELADLRDVPHAIVVHASTVTDQTYLSCGEIEGISVTDEVVVPLLPVTEHGLTGLAIMGTGENGFLGIGGDAELTSIHLWPWRVPITLQALLPPTATPEPTATPQPTPTVEPTTTALPPTSTPVSPTDTPVPPTPVAELTATPEVIELPVETIDVPAEGIELPTEVLIEFGEADLNPAEFTIQANTDTEFTLANLTLQRRTFFIEATAVTQEVPVGETVAIVVNMPVGDYVYGLLEDEAVAGTLHVVEPTE
jgi:hypothetical protein